MPPKDKLIEEIEPKQCPICLSYDCWVVQEMRKENAIKR